MNTILIKKIKQALKKNQPIESIKEIISEYEELRRLSEWRYRTIKNSKTIERYKEELDRINELLENSGYYSQFIDDDIDSDIKKYFITLTKNDDT